jgi:hypothetical protein
MAWTRYRLADSYVLAELQSRYGSVGIDGRIRVLEELATEDSVPPYEVALLAATDPHDEVRRWFALHAKRLDYRETNETGVEAGDQGRDLVEHLKRDASPLVRAALRENPTVLGLFPRPEDSHRWFQESSQLERLALVRNPKIHRELILQLFDPQERNLGIDLESRFRLMLRRAY